jgi:hypothetical protein
VVFGVVGRPRIGSSLVAEFFWRRKNQHFDVPTARCRPPSCQRQWRGPGESQSPLNGRSIALASLLVGSGRDTGRFGSYFVAGICSWNLVYASCWEWGSPWWRFVLFLLLLLLLFEEGGGGGSGSGSGGWNLWLAECDTRGPFASDIFSV